MTAAMMMMMKVDGVLQREMEERNLRPRLCYLTKGERGYGFHLHGERSSGAQFIRRIEAGSPAELAGLRSGDRVVEVNGENVENDSHHQVVQKIMEVENRTRLLVVDRETDEFLLLHSLPCTEDLAVEMSCLVSPRVSSSSLASSTLSFASSSRGTRTPSPSDSIALSPRDFGAHSLSGAVTSLMLPQSTTSSPPDSIAPLPSDSVIPSPLNSSPSPEDLINQSPYDSITQSPSKPDTQSSYDSITQSPSNPDTQSSYDSITQFPSNPDTQSPYDSITQFPSKPVTQSPYDSITQFPSKPVTQSPYDSITQFPSKPVTQSPYDSITQFPSKPVTQSPYDPITQSPSKPVTQSPYDSITQSPPNPVTQSPYDPITQSPPNPVTQSPYDSITQSPPNPVTQSPNTSVTQSLYDSITRSLSNPIPQFPSNPKNQSPYDSVPHSPSDTITTPFTGTTSEETHQMDDTGSTDNQETSGTEDTVPRDLRPRLCHMVQDDQGFGFNLHCDKRRVGQFIRSVDPDSPAQRAGLRPGDRLVQVNGRNIESLRHSEVVNLIRGGGKQTKLLLVDLDTDDLFKKLGITPTTAHLNDDCVDGPLTQSPTSTCPITGLAVVVPPIRNESLKHHLSHGSSASSRSISSDMSVERSSFDTNNMVVDSGRRECNSAPPVHEEKTPKDSDPLWESGLRLSPTAAEARQKVRSKKANKTAPPMAWNKKYEIFCNF